MRACLCLAERQKELGLNETEVRKGKTGVCVSVCVSLDLNPVLFIWAEFFRRHHSRRPRSQVRGAAIHQGIADQY